MSDIGQPFMLHQRMPLADIRIADARRAIAMAYRQDYNATAKYFESRAARTRGPEERTRLLAVAAEYRARARQQAEKRATTSDASSKADHPQPQS